MSIYVNLEFSGILSVIQLINLCFHHIVDVTFRQIPKHLLSQVWKRFWVAILKGASRNSFVAILCHLKEAYLLLVCMSIEIKTWCIYLAFKLV